MSRASSTGQQRSLTLTEELEKLEQSITLTLQEIDHNFSRAHRIVTSSILPIVEQYSQHSRDVWEGSKFWKQFFESSANVSLSGYEEQPSIHEPLEDTATEDSNATTHTTLETSQSYETPSAQHVSTDSIQDMDLSNLTISPSHSTPRPNIQNRQTTNVEPTTTFADYPSPYEALRQELNNSIEATNLSHVPAPETPGKSSAVVNDSRAIVMTPQSSPFLPLSPSSIPRPSTARKKTDPLLHRVLDRNYRVQATPMGNNRHSNLPTAKHAHAKATITPVSTRNRLLDSTLSSSPVIPAPKLHAEIFSSPMGKSRTPGVSVLTPAKGKSQPRSHGVWDSDDEFEDEDNFGQSPPKTMQFHIPQSRLLKTPAKEASKRIVEDLLTTAGLFMDRDEDDSRGFDENSPNVVRKAAGFEDESF